MNNTTLILITFIFVLLMFIFFVMLVIWGTKSTTNITAGGTCSKTSDCAPGLVCYFGKCKSLTFTSCSNNNNACQVGDTCINGVCIPLKAHLLNSL